MTQMYILIFYHFSILRCHRELKFSQRNHGTVGAAQAIVWLLISWEILCCILSVNHDDVIKWKHLCGKHLCGELTGPRWIPHTKASDAELWCSLICVWINDWVNNGETGDLRRYRAHYDVIVMSPNVGPVHIGEVSLVIIMPIDAPVAICYFIVRDSSDYTFRDVVHSFLVYQTFWISFRWSGDICQNGRRHPPQT